MFAISNKEHEKNLKKNMLAIPFAGHTNIQLKAWKKWL